MYPSSSTDFSYDPGCRAPPSAPPQPPTALPPSPVSPPSYIHPYDNIQSTGIDNHPTNNFSASKSNPHFYTHRLTPQYSRPVAWSSGVCDCFDDVHSCCLTCCCPCVTFGRIAEIVDRGSTSCSVSATLYALLMCATGCSCMYSCFYRSKLRGQYFLEESPCADCCIHCCCEGCALCQEYRQLQNQDFDMSIGWHGNMERRKRALAMPYQHNVASVGD